MVLLTVGVALYPRSSLITLRLPLPSTLNTYHIPHTKHNTTQGVPACDLEERLREILISEFGATPKAAAA